MSKNSEKINISINYNGLDVTVLVDMETANILLNDPQVAEEYIRHLLNPNPSEMTEPEVEDDENEVGSHESCEGGMLDRIPIWSNRKPTDLDHSATVAFLNLRQKYSEQFDDKKTRKGSLWGIIGNKMMEMGYYLGESKRDIIEKVRQKFANLQKQYLAYVKHMETTGQKRKDPPPYFDEMHSILGFKDKVNPQNMQDSLVDKESSENTDILENTESDIEDCLSQSASTSTQVQNRFSSVSRVRPPSVNQQILREIKQQHKNILEERRRQFEVLEKNFLIQNEQRTLMLNKFDRFLNIISQKRKRERSSSDSD